MDKEWSQRITKFRVRLASFKNRPIKGKCFFTLPLGMVNIGGSPSNYTMAVSAGLYIDDGSETLIGAVVEKSFTAINLFMEAESIYLY